MEASTLQAYENRAAEAELRLNSLELLLGKKGGGGDPAFLKATLKQLYDLRIAMGTARNEMSAIEKERDQAVAHVAELQKENEKNDYRIKHLLRALSEMHEKHGSPESPQSSSFNIYQEGAMKKGRFLT
eukprot:CAMPEP_0196589278 /NCGR_PEP_ID=MMETSP1081-20130531/63175_1 /TAXON_ID=36882 /ORGANISM="Pyramimonas amylifera, Strain CCMP720" /LENGTH=128 /DNA_ID=CAMNT_0041912035 /DNA_START=173 /DNA_END=559 /DNA_ORIENTATION=-